MKKRRLTFFFILLTLYAGTSVCQKTGQPIQNRYSYRIKVHSTLPEFLFTVVLDTLPNDWGQTPTVSRIEVRMSDKTKILQSLYVPFTHMQFDPVQFECRDFNFDGYLDLSLLCETPSGGGVSSIWLFDKKSQRFTYDAELSDMTSLRVDTTNRTLVSTMENGACCGTTWTYRVVRGRPVLLHEETTSMDDRGLITNTKKIYSRGKVTSVTIDTVR